MHDTGGGERFRTLTSNFYRNADAAILMYSVEDRYTFENLQEWIENTQDSVDLDTFVWAIVGNKSDLPLEIEHDSIRARAEQLGAANLSFFTSAKNGENVISSFEKIVVRVHEKKAGKSEAQKTNADTVNIRQTSTSQQKKCC